MIGRIGVALAAAATLVFPSAGLASPQPGTVTSDTYGSGLTAYPYLVYTPTSYKPGLPLLVMLHGCQTTATEQMKANLYNPLADQKRFVVLYPDVNPVEQAQPGPIQNCWQYPNPLDWLRGENDDAAVAAITQAVMAGWGIDPQRVYLMGMSAGSFLTADMAATYPDIYAAVGENAGGDYEDPACTLQSEVTLPVTTTSQDAFTQMGPRARVVPRIVIGGDADQGIPAACADKALEQGLRTDNLVITHGHDQTAPISLSPATSVPGQVPGGYGYTVSSHVDGHRCVVGQRWLVHGMNHFWSGGSSDPKLANYTDPKGPSAAIASWNFFSHFTLANTAWSCAESPSLSPPPTTTVSLPQLTCADHRHFSFRLHHPRGERIVSAVVYVNGKVVTRVHGRNLHRLTLAPLPRGNFTIRIRTTTNTGAHATSLRHYNACTQTAPSNHTSPR